MNDSTDRLLERCAELALHGQGGESGQDLRSLCHALEATALEYEVAATALQTGLKAGQRIPVSTGGLPDALRRRLEAAAEGFVAEHSAAPPGTTQAPPRAPSRATTEPASAPRPVPRIERFARLRPLAAGLIALIGAGILLALIAREQGFELGSLFGGPSVEAARERLISSAGAELVRWSFGPGPDASGAAASGDVLWSSARQEGYMRLVGLAPNDPGDAQYQLWIFDAARPEEPPVDGGVFDIAERASGAGGESIVRIDPKLAVGTPTLFAITVERPGGVVVSKKERIAALAQP